MSQSDESASPGRLASMLTRLVACDDLPDPLPSDPMRLLTAWYEEAERSGGYDDFNAMTLATATADGIPSARVVLCKAIEHAPPAMVFYTSYESRKGRELSANPRAAAVFHWPHARRQVRVEGRIDEVTAAESDAYFASRPLLSRVGACVSRQSTAISNRAELVERAMTLARRAAAGSLERPPHWGGYRLHISHLELWSGRSGRLHDRVRWTRDCDSTSWTHERLSP